MNREPDANLTIIIPQRRFLQSSSSDYSSYNLYIGLNEPQRQKTYSQPSLHYENMPIQIY